LVGWLNLGPVCHFLSNFLDWSFRYRRAAKPNSIIPPGLTHYKYRFLNFANPSRVLATEDPTFEDFLRVDDDHFNDAVRHIILHSQQVRAYRNLFCLGTTSRLRNLRTRSPLCQGFVFKIGHFGTLAQATYLISQSLEIIRSSSAISFNLDESTLEPETIQLCRTLEALVRANEMEVTVRRLAFWCQSLVSYR